MASGPQYDDCVCAQWCVARSDGWVHSVGWTSWDLPDGGKMDKGLAAAVVESRAWL